MSFTKLKTTVAIGAVILGLGFAIPARAVDNQTITATINSVGALDVLAVAQMGFGTWYFTGVSSGNEVVLVKATTGGITATPAGAATATVVGAANTTPAQLTVAITGGGASHNGTVLDMIVTAPTAFSDTDAVLSDLTYRTATQTGENAITANGVAVHPVTLVAGATPEPVFFGGTITVDDPLTAGPITSTFNASFAY